MNLKWLLISVFFMSQKCFSKSTTRNRDIALTTPAVATKHGYKAQTHHVTTEDGYILTLHRIFSDKGNLKGKHPVLLQHGLGETSNDFVDAVDVSLAFLLADEGFDVWLGNARGNAYSEEHVSLFTINPEFWNYSYHDMGIYDIPAFTNYILNETNNTGDIFYVGHSQGCNSFYVYASFLPDIAAKQIKVAFTLAPASFLGGVVDYVKEPFILVAENKWILDLLGVTHINLQYFTQQVAYHCYDTIFSKLFCRVALQILAGFDCFQIKEKDYPAIYAHTGGNIAVKEQIHLAQSMMTDEFRMYDYGPQINLKVYGNRNAPEYDLEKVKIPTYIYYGKNDHLIKEKDAKKLADRLPKNKLFKGIPNFNHIDFVFSKNVRKLVYTEIVDVFKRNLPKTNN